MQPEFHHGLPGGTLILRPYCRAVDDPPVNGITAARTMAERHLTGASGFLARTASVLRAPTCPEETLMVHRVLAVALFSTALVTPNAWRAADRPGQAPSS